MDLRQSTNYANYLRLRGWVVEKANGSYIFIRKIPLMPFSIIKLQRPKTIPLKELEQLAKKHHAFQIIIEPCYHTSVSDNKAIKDHSYHLSRSPFLPTRTLRLDLTQTERKIMAQMKKDARYGTRKAREKRVAIFKIFKDLEIERFSKTWRKSIGWCRWSSSLRSLVALKKAFGKKAIFLVAICDKNTSEVALSEANGPPARWREITAGAVILIANKTAYYYYAFTSKEGRQKFTQYLLVWEAIKLAKKQSCKIFDFEGIYDKRFPNKAWKGFSHFKKSFGGQEIEYPGCFVKYCLPF